MSLRRYTVPLVVAVYALYVVWWGRQGVVASVTSAHDVRNERNATLGFASYVRQTAGATSSRLQDQLAALRRFSDDPYPAVTRVLFTENDVKARAYVRGLMADAGLEVAVDGMGSIIGSWRVGDGDGVGAERLRQHGVPGDPVHAGVRAAPVPAVRADHGTLLDGPPAGAALAPAAAQLRL